MFFRQQRDQQANAQAEAVAQQPEVRVPDAAVEDMPPPAPPVAEIAEIPSVSTSSLNINQPDSTSGVTRRRTNEVDNGEQPSED